jgi:prepilin-type N-terminal cleavage/methylation domain-containing protein
MKLKLTKQEKGFTIIEVLIVLAIAGLIILIVFLAVPALQRNSRNTQRKNDAARASGAVQEVANNNNGQIPAGVAAPGSISGGNYSQLTNVDWNIDANRYQPLAAINNVTMAVRNYSLCANAAASSDGGSASVNGGNRRQVTLTYLIESPGAAGGTVNFPDPDGAGPATAQNLTVPAGNVAQCLVIS